MDKHTRLPFTLGIIMQRLPLQSRWQDWQWKVIDILPDMDRREVMQILAGEGEQRWLFPGFAVELFTDETPGYFLNLSSETPCWFVMWRLEEIGGQEVAVPKFLTLSYDEAARRIDSGEQVDIVPLSEDIAAWLAEYTQTHFRYEGKKPRKRPSFEGGEGVQKMAEAELARGKR